VFVNTAWSLLPPLLTIALAIFTRKVYLALGLGILSGAIMLESSIPAGVARSVGLVWETLSQPRNALFICFIFVVGALISSIQGVGGIQGLASWLERKGYLSTRRSIRMLAWWSGVCLFIESNMTIMVAGTLARPLFDKWKISREKLAYLIDSTSGPICLIIPLNAWGVYVIGLLQTVGVRDPVRLLAESILYNFYSVLAVLLALVVAMTGWSPGPMKLAEQRTQDGKLLFDGSEPMADESLFGPHEEIARPSKWLIILPLGTVVATMPLALISTGHLNAPEASSTLEVIEAGSGGLSLLASALAGLLVLGITRLWRGGEESTGLFRLAARGARGMVGLAGILLLALTLGLLTKLLGTGEVVAGLASANVSPALFLPLAFVLSALISFSTGTSWGTFAIMIPVVIPTADTFNLAQAPFLAAALSGGVFGDHASPISNTTIIASMAALTNTTDHVRTQLPYCLMAGVGSVVGYFLVGICS
jgi:tetracycline resistance efflux pump